MALYNRINGKELKEKLQHLQEERTTVSFYKYHQLADPKAFRDELYQLFDQLHILGRIYVAHEGINAQISVPSSSFETFRSQLFSISF